MPVQTAVAPFTEGNGTGQQAPATPQRPENVPEKFWDAEKGVVRTEDLLKSYTELEKARTGAGKTSEETPPAEAATEETATDKAAEEAAAAAGVDIASYEAKFAEKGSLEDSDYAALETKGFSREDVDDFIAYRTSKGEKAQAEYLEVVGGAEQLEAMQTWAAQNYTPEQVEDFNDAVNSGKKARIQTALKALKADYAAANPAPKPRPKPINGGGASEASANGGTFKSMAELMAAQKDPRYYSDAAYRDEVVAKLARSNIR